MNSIMNWDKLYWKFLAGGTAVFGATQLLHIKDFDLWWQLLIIIGIPAFAWCVFACLLTFAFVFDRKYSTKDLTIEKANDKQTQELKEYIDKRVNGKIDRIIKTIDEYHKGDDNNEQNIKNDN